MLGTLGGVFRRPQQGKWVLLVVALAIATGGITAVAADAATTPTFTVQGSVEQVAVTNAPKARSPSCSPSSGKTVATAKTDAARRALFRDVQPGAGYIVRVGGASADGIVVTTPTDTPPQAFYSSQTINDGFGYLKTRDGTLLSINVKLRARPRSARTPPSSSTRATTRRIPPARRRRPRSRRLLGYATVGVNLRGTGCSGGAFDYFETLQSLDGYDAIETVAAQPWVANGKVGMVGISYPGISAAVRRADPSAAPRRDHAAVGDRRHLPDALPGWDPERRLRARLGEDRSADAAPAGQKWAARPHRQRRQGVRGEPGAAPADHRTCSTTSTACATTRHARRCARAGDVRRQDQRARRSSAAVAGREDRRALRRHARRLRAGRPGEVHAHERRAQRRARPCGHRRWASSSTSTSRGASRRSPRRTRARRRPADAVLRPA